MSALEKHQTRKISVAVITGPKDTGKTFLSSMVAKTPTACKPTNGIAMWSNLITLLDDDGNDTGVDLLLLDTEGLHSAERGFDIDVKIFALAVLLGSVLVYNQKGHISDQSMENLSILQMLPTEIKFKHQHESSGDFKKFFPEMCWVLRDFEMEFKSLTPESYLE
jgi:hypothetical protein